MNSNRLKAFLMIAGFLGALGAPADEIRAPLWPCIVPLAAKVDEQLVEDAVFLGERTMADGLAWSCTLVPEGDPAMDKASVYAERFARIAPRVRARSKIRQGFLIQAMLGHGWTPGLATPWQKPVYCNGSSSYRFCPLGKEFREYIVRQCRTLAAAKPDFIMTDDDVKLLGNPIDGCFCPLHLAEFAKRTGVSRSREELVEAINRDPALGLEWKLFSESTVEDFTRLVRAQFPDDVPGMFCYCDGPRLAYSTNCVKIIAGPKARPASRLASAPYWADGLEDVIDVRRRVARQLSILGPCGDTLIEADTCPQLRWQTSATRALDHISILIAEGCTGALMWWHRMGNRHECRSSTAYLKAFAERTKVLAWLTDAKPVMKGVWLPAPENGPEWGANALGRMGFAYHYGAREPGDVAALTAASAAVLDGAALTNVLSGPVLLDGSAAIALTVRGFGDLIGVRAKPWQGKAITFEDFGDVKLMGAMGKNPADLSDRAAESEEVSRLYNRISSMAEKSDYIAPGSVWFENARGGRVLTLAATVPAGPNYKLWDYGCCNETRQAWLDRMFRRLGGRIPGGVRCLGDQPLLCESGVTRKGERIVILDNLDLDVVEAPELVFDAVPRTIERLSDAGTWDPVRMSMRSDGTVVVETPLVAHRPAFLRLN